MKKVLVIGSGGAGKSIFAKRLGRILQIEVIHLDAFYWNPGWVETPKPEWRKTVEELLRRDSWIMDGNFSSTLDMRLEACDTVIFMDMARRICLWRVIKRLIKYRNRNRPDMAEGCLEKFDIKFIGWVWSYRKRARPKVAKLLEENSEIKKVIWLRTQAEVEKFLACAKDT
jgi:adenylate kinase family enzyme